ncbi:MAG: hypothetical protein Q7S95_04005 [bacterium]|nr:hypothetical protein [bacterium]
MPSSLNAYLRSFLLRFSYGLRPNPARDWIALLILSAFVLVLIAAWNLWAFKMVVNGGTLGSVATSTPSSLDQTSLDTIKNLFTSRATEAAKYQDGTYRFADPSQ